MTLEAQIKKSTLAAVGAGAVFDDLLAAVVAQLPGVARSTIAVTIVDMCGRELLRSDDGKIVVSGAQLSGKRRDAGRQAA
jgi:hypothetical protein